MLTKGFLWVSVFRVQRYYFFLTYTTMTAVYWEIILVVNSRYELGFGVCEMMLTCKTLNIKH